ncbi:hypothetical protein M413DRAFT_415939, partial [Hebeloma cylindrosporum]
NMLNYTSPLVDEKNPLYCPAIPAADYLKELRFRTQKTAKAKNLSGQKLSHSFGHSLEQSSREGPNNDDSVGSDWVLGDYFTSGQGWFSSQSPGPEDLPPYSPTVPVRPQSKVPQIFEMPSPGAKRIFHDLKRKNGFSDFAAPPKYARSLLSLHESSFDLEVWPEKLQFTGIKPSPADAANALRDRKPATTDLDRLIDDLDSELSGIRLKERLWRLGAINPQSLMDFLCMHAHINQRTLHILRETNVERISFTTLMEDGNGLNLTGRDIYSVFSKPDSYRLLSELSFSGIRIQDSDICHIHHLPSLSTLLLDETGIGNEGVFLLVSLKRTLTRLSIASNPDIDNEAVPALLLLSNLSFLSILDTAIDMVGLRRLADFIHKTDQMVDIEIPYACQEYVDKIHTKYLFNPLPPLVVNPHICGKLSDSALRRNLEAHAACNPFIVPSGTRQELVERLSEILKIRKLDMLVVEMLGGDDSTEGK